MTSRTGSLTVAAGNGRTKRWTRAAIWSWKMDALTRRGLVNAVVLSGTQNAVGIGAHRRGLGCCDGPRWRGLSCS